MSWEGGLVRALSAGLGAWLGEQSWLGFDENAPVDQTFELGADVLGVLLRDGQVQRCDPNITIPPEKLSFLHRLDGKLADERRRTLTYPKCIQIFGAGYSKGNAKQCDEYSFASTWERWEFKPLVPDIPFSLCVIPTPDNRIAGDRENRFYSGRRILHGDRFSIAFSTKISIPSSFKLCGKIPKP
ncbi:hypothetical protein ACGFNP_20355 [Nonomuraea sp. NPDC049269]|uniref:hypothetical protein n=1 Tax=Nonomuraea sp. NPDC049269 TaxID=3364349 RepID=UPI003710FEAC